MVLQRGGLERQPRQIELRVVEPGFPQLCDLLRERLSAVRRASDAHGRAKETVPIRLPGGLQTESSVWRSVVLELLFIAAVGIAIGLSLAAPPGPVNAIIASRTVTRSWRAGFLVGAGATTADTIFLALTVMAHSLLGSIATWLPYISLLGAAVMAYFAWTAVRALRSPEEILAPRAEAEAKSYAIGLSVNITSPYPILWWLTAGLVLIDQLGAAVLVGFYAGILLWITAFPLAVREAQRRIRRTYHAMLLFSIVCLVAFAGWLVWSAVDALLL
ncbi:MAG: LysE family translocator [Methanobacteriota archaeon]|nr:MAG: LysE family translocator [Euryarchaeota archaeon]TLZ82514.1 MAG: LysE family translocator [Euryarchaeota archaeon]